MKIAKECILSFSCFGTSRGGVDERNYTYVCMYVWQVIYAHSCKYINLYVDMCVCVYAYVNICYNACAAKYKFLCATCKEKSKQIAQLHSTKTQTHVYTYRHTQRRLFMQKRVFECALHACYVLVVVTKVQLQQANYSFYTI